MHPQQQQQQQQHCHSQFLSRNQRAGSGGSGIESILAKAAYLPTFWKLGVALQEGKSSSRSKRTSKTSALTVSRLVIPCARAGRRRRTQVELQSEK
jgi:hypothetical protein